MNIKHKVKTPIVETQIIGSPIFLTNPNSINYLNDGYDTINYGKPVAEFKKSNQEWTLKAEKIINPGHLNNDSVLLGSGNVGHRTQIIDLT